MPNHNFAKVLCYVEVEGETVIIKESTQITEVNRVIQDTEGKCLTFAFGPEEYALEILKVREIMVILEITATEAASEQDKQ